MRSEHVKQPVCASVHVEAPARLHLGFIDLNGSLGRRFGSLGLTLQGNGTSLKLAPAKTLKVTGPAHASSRALAYATYITGRLGLPSGVDIEIHSATPDHAGLGSGTQMALAIASALSRLYGLGLDSQELAVLTGRGKRSGIGIGAFDSGGFLLDGGRGETNRPPPVIVQRDFPEHWRMLLIFDLSGRGIHGKTEISAFQTLPVFPDDSAAELSRLVLMQALPALAEGDCDRFGHAVGRLQQVVGDYFAPAQSGRYASIEVAEVLSWIEAQGIAGIGQSSWGPTGFAILPDEAAGQEVLRQLHGRFGERPNLRFEITSARNHGTRIEVCAVTAGHAALRTAM